MVGERRLVEAARLHLPVRGELFHDEVDEPDLFHGEACLVQVLGERLLSGPSVQPHQGADEEAEATGLLGGLDQVGVLRAGPRSMSPSEVRSSGVSGLLRRKRCSATWSMCWRR